MKRIEHMKKETAEYIRNMYRVLDSAPSEEKRAQSVGILNFLDGYIHAVLEHENN